MDNLTPIQIMIIGFAVGYLVGLLGGILSERRRK